VARPDSFEASSQQNRQHINIVVVPIFIVILTVLSLTSVLITSLIFQAFHQSIPFWETAVKLAGSIVAGLVFSAALRFPSNCSGLRNRGAKVLSFLNKISGWVAELVGLCCFSSLAAGRALSQQCSLTPVVRSGVLFPMSRKVKRQL